MASKLLWNDSSQTDVGISKQQFEEMLREVLHEISFEVLPFGYNPAIEKAVIKYFLSHGIAPEFIERHIARIRSGSWFGQSVFSHLPIEVQERVGIFTSIMTVIDDHSDEDINDLKDFQVRIFRGQRQANPLFEALMQCTYSFRELYGPFASDMITKGVMDFISSCFLESKYEDKLAIAPSASDFPDYLRLKTGMGEIYAFFAFPESLYPEEIYLHQYVPAIPELSRLYNNGNDLLSFYKESIVGDDRSTFLRLYSDSHNTTLLQSLQDACAATIDCVRNLRATLSVDQSMRKNIDQLFCGYMMYHFCAPRYKLWDLAIQEIDDVKERVQYPISQC